MKRNLFKTLLFFLPVLIGMQGIAQTTYNVPERIYYKFNTVGTTVTNDASAPVGTNPAPIIGGLTVGAGGFSATNGLIGTGQTSTGNTVNTGWNTDMTGDFTIAFWTSAVPSSATLYYIFGDNGANGFRCFTNGTAGAGNWLVRIPNGGDVTLTGGATNASKMMHVVYDASALSVTAYVDGVQIDQATLTAPLNETGTGLTVGGYTSSSGLSGVLDEFRWYDRALDANEIGLTYNQELPFVVVCGVPQNFAETNLTSTTVDITWDHGSGNDNYQLEYGPVGFTPGTGTVLSGAITGASTTENITGLTANTTYDYYITEDCNGGGDELTFGTYTFTTDCGIETAPFSENFDGPTWTSGTGFNNTGDAINQCWTRNAATGFIFGTRTGTTSNGNTGPSGDFNGGGNYIYTEASVGTNGDVATMVSPVIDISGLTTPYLMFYYHMYGADLTTLTVDVSSDGGSTWTTESTIVGQQQATNGDAWLEELVDLAAYAGNSIQVRFSTTKGGFDADLAIDQVDIQEAPTCFKPTDFTATTVTDVSVDLSWTNGATETMWNIEYGPIGFTPGTGTFISVTTNPYTLPGLTPETFYDIYIQADCGGGDESDWVGPVTVQTECSALTAPYLESFDTGVLPNCWTNTSSNSGSANGLWKFTGSAGYGASGNGGRPAGTFAWTDGSTPVVNDITLLSPLIDMSALTVPMLSFDWFSNNTNAPGDNVPLIVDINDGSGWTNLVTLSGDNANWQDAELTLGSYIGQTVQFRFICDQTATSGLAQYNDILLDSVLVDEAPTCPRPYNLIVSNITANDADASWTQGYQETQWIVEYDTAGFPQGTGMTIVTSNLSEALTGLSSSTDYDVYVRGICGPSDTSDWTGPISFTTPCDVYLAPFYESFDNGVQPNCWENVATGTASTDFWQFDGAPGYAAANNGRPDDTYAWSDGSGSEPEGTLITPFIDVTTIIDPYLTFEWFSNNENTPGDNVPLYIEINGGTVWTPLDTLSGDSTEWMRASYDLSAYEDSTIRIRFITDHTVTSGLAFYNDILLDEVRVWSCTYEAGADNATDVCRLDEMVDLNSTINIVTEGGRWDFPLDQSLVVDDTMLNVQILPSGTYDAFYIVEAACQSDTAFATITIYPPSSAGENGTLEVCLNQPIDLFSGLNGNIDLGGTWYDPSNTPIAGSQPVASNVPGNFNYDYIASNGVCPADTSLLVVTVDGSCDYLSIGEEQLSEINVYPNPATDVVNISNPSNSEALSIVMFDVNGRVVLSDANALLNVSEASINIQDLQKGIYTLRIYNDKGQRTFRIVKQ
jgi:hypothetical protein